MPYHAKKNEERPFPELDLNRKDVRRLSAAIFLQACDDWGMLIKRDAGHWVSDSMLAKTDYDEIKQFLHSEFAIHLGDVLEIDPVAIFEELNRQRKIFLSTGALPRPIKKCQIGQEIKFERKKEQWLM